MFINAVGNGSSSSSSSSNRDVATPPLKKLFFLQWLLARACPGSLAEGEGGGGLDLLSGRGDDPQLHPPREHPTLHGRLLEHATGLAGNRHEVQNLCSKCKLSFIQRSSCNGYDQQRLASLTIELKPSICSSISCFFTSHFSRSIV